jgi:hypothetical protein
MWRVVMKRVGVGLASLVLAFPGVSSAAQAQAPEAGGGVAIDHKEIGCIVAEKFPKLSACFSPSANVARARVYFRAEGGTSWYYVDMKADAPCMSGILPKPRKEMIDKHVDYYVHATDKAFTEARTLEYNPVVVASEGACKDKPIAGALSKASVSVFPSVPAGFAAGGRGAGVVVGGGLVAAGAAGGIYAATKSNNDTTTTTSPTAVVTTTLPTVTTTTPGTTPTTAPPQGTPTFRFSFVLSPLKGTEPVDVTVDMCGSLPETSLRYFYDFDGDGIDDFQGPFCSQTRTYKVASVDVFPAGRIQPSPSGIKTNVWTVRGCAEPRNPEVQPQGRQCQTGTVQVQSLPTTTTTFGSGRPSSNGWGQSLSWSSQLDVAGASGQVVLNSASTAFSAAGRSSAVAEGRKGQNRVEAQLVEATGKPGTWRFEFGATPSFRAGSLRVVAGDVAAVTADAVTFRLKGTPGERVVFTFETEH